ncbi:hypothetical protein W97_08795 [Coniosporium apollinis CBS 100218]|uniref:SET domain-containing protein n=1 Tax=Coniosporium apollinis (strain CBS 100218) TaxID=1168221 RepID=R7Z5S7_CONA1|nr:uncharacterized protein W97_08795 [Coniosporium apollinis CBS 100218]EON69535.1 hypothetical protein W97_08795 [Coniosporium apollinis CBS 100218]
MSAQNSLQSVNDTLNGLTISPTTRGLHAVEDSSRDDGVTSSVGATSGSNVGADGSNNAKAPVNLLQEADSGLSKTDGIPDGPVVSIKSRKDGLEALLSNLETLRENSAEKPYSISNHLALAEAYANLGYPDLCAGEAYKALLLVDELSDESGEYHELVVEAAEADIRQAKDGARPLAEQSLQIEANAPVVNEDDGVTDALAQDAMAFAEKQWSGTAYIQLTESLMACGCLKSALEYCKRGCQAHTENSILRRLDQEIRHQLQQYFENRGITWEEKDMNIEDYPDRGLVRRELYPWNDHEPDRCSENSLRLLNEQMVEVAPKLEVRATSLPLLTTSPEGPPEVPKTVTQLGVFAKEDISPGETILDERSLLTASARSDSPLCDACSAALPITALAAEGVIYCEDCDDTPFCSQTCHDLAVSAYHPAICGADADAIAKDAPAAGAADALYSLLLCRALAMAETQDIHPLDLPEVKFIWGDYHSLTLSEVWTSPHSSPDPFRGIPQTLPFSFTHNILHPLHFLEKMNVNIFESTKYDTWVLNTLYAKFRGTASARQSADGRPAVGAVHPLWCLANHSCDPNVSWVWEGSMKFTVREQRVLWKGREIRERPGLRKGEEVVGHYCDIDLDVGERREWAAGALGGDCMCERCVWEERVEMEEKEKKEVRKTGG